MGRGLAAVEHGLLIFPISVLVNLIVQYIVLRTARLADQHEPRIEILTLDLDRLPAASRRGIIGENLKNILIVSAALVLSPEQVAVITVALSLTGLNLPSPRPKWPSALPGAARQDRKRTNKFGDCRGTKIAPIVAFRSCSSCSNRSPGFFNTIPAPATSP